MKNWIIFDIDGVIADARWREHLITEKGWDDFHLSSVQDAPFEDAKELLRGLVVSPFATVAITGRPERYRKLTNEWLSKSNIPLDELLMRRNDDLRPPADCKLDLADDFFQGNIVDAVVCIFDDDPTVIDAFKQIGVTGMLVNHARTND